MSKKKNMLRELSKKVPTAPEIEQLIAGLHEKDDIHLAIMGVALVEARLDNLLVRWLARNDSAFMNRLFESPGPMSSFSNKILTAEAFGVIRTALADELNSMRTIRNAFAHAKLPITFDDRPVSGEVDKLKMLEEIRSSGTIIKTKLTNKRWFLLAMEIALLTLDTLIKMKNDASATTTA
jgi:hypothetical protein